MMVPFFAPFSPSENSVSGTVSVNHVLFPYSYSFFRSKILIASLPRPSSVVWQYLDSSRSSFFYSPSFSDPPPLSRSGPEFVEPFLTVILWTNPLNPLLLGASAVRMLADLF